MTVPSQPSGISSVLGRHPEYEPFFFKQWSEELQHALLLPPHFFQVAAQSPVDSVGAGGGVVGGGVAGGGVAGASCLVASAKSVS